MKGLSMKGLSMASHLHLNLTLNTAVQPPTNCSFHEINVIVVVLLQMVLILTTVIITLCSTNCSFCKNVVVFGFFLFTNGVYI